MARIRHFAGVVRKAVPKLAAWLDETATDTLGVYTLDDLEHRRKLRTTNSLEHDHAEVMRRSRVVRIFPNETSLLRLLTALTIQPNEQWMERRYLTMTEDTQDQLRHSA